jgi:hypothetical protein
MGVEIFSVHPSIRSMLAKGLKFKPRNMATLRMDREQHETLQRISMEIFVDCVNVGVPFQEAIAAIYLSGLQHGSELSKELESAGV